ncbi:hypothetical protein THAOC_03862 [Thalassiosira oceanica]|uniref:Uncharacterized protein n=1 Tax=Thalassiosira oceanica TaxID=159749 RepID=K0TAA8_THAOC|nr:hypothetical protein THAOC_03862 [Thalassiosira oceanica]|eukprot:EJK74460.1 hypothetical protein THAOC_03862 [Thalassiosira oceanica]
MWRRRRGAEKGEMEQIVYVGDVANAVLAAMQYGPPQGGDGSDAAAASGPAAAPDRVQVHREHEGPRREHGADTPGARPVRPPLVVRLGVVVVRRDVVASRPRDIAPRRRAEPRPPGLGALHPARGGDQVDLGLARPQRIPVRPPRRRAEPRRIPGPTRRVERDAVVHEPPVRLRLPVVGDVHGLAVGRRRARHAGDDPVVQVRDLHGRPPPEPRPARQAVEPVEARRLGRLVLQDRVRLVVEQARSVAVPHRAVVGGGERLEEGRVVVDRGGRRVRLVHARGGPGPAQDDPDAPLRRPGREGDLRQPPPGDTHHRPGRGGHDAPRDEGEEDEGDEVRQGRRQERDRGEAPAPGAAPLGLLHEQVLLPGGVRHEQGAEPRPVRDDGRRRPETKDVKVQVQFYEQAAHLTRINMQRSPNYQEFFQDNLFPFDFVRTTWLVHELRSEAGRNLRCEMYEEQALWGNPAMEDLSIGYVLARKKVRSELGRKAEPQYEGPEEWHPLLVPGEPDDDAAAGRASSPEGPLYLDYLEDAQKVATDSKGAEFHVTFLPQKSKSEKK